MEQFFKRIIKKREKIEKYYQEIKELDSKIEELKEQQIKISDELLKERKKLIDLTEIDKKDNMETLVNLISLLIIVLSIGGSLFYISKTVMFLDMIINTIKCVIAIFFINGINLILNKIANILIKKYFIKIEEKNMLAIEQQKNKVEILLTKNSTIEKTLSSYRNKKYNILEKIQKEKNEIVNINNILIEELAPLLDDLIDKEVKNDNLELTQAINNISRKLIKKEEY